MRAIGNDRPRTIIFKRSIGVAASVGIFRKDALITVDVKEFEYLVTVAELGSVTKAANQLFITQSALSKFIKNKEDEMGTKLFSRNGKRFVPTYAGEKCIEAAHKIIDIRKQLTDDLTRIVNLGKGRIRLAFHSSWSDFFFMNIYPLFQNKYAEVDLQIFEINSSDALQKLDKGEIDLAIVATSWKKHSRFICHTLRTQRFVLAVRDGHSLLEKAEKRSGYPYPYIELNQLNGIPLILRHTTQKTRTYTMELLQNVGFKPRIALETQSRENALRAVEYGVGVAFTLDDPTLLINHDKIRFISFEELNPCSYINIVYNNGTYFSNAEHDLIKLISDQYLLFCENYS